MKNHLSLLSLGDSYTIGEGVLMDENFPSLTAGKLEENNFKIDKPKIIAATGWATSDLLSAIEEENIQQHFDLVTLLIGVNNQYQQKSKKIYQEEFSELLDKAIEFAGDKNYRVFVMSIPDYGVTPFAKEKDPSKISYEIQQYNSLNFQISLSQNVNYVDIYPESLLAKNDIRLLTTDHLHPSKKQYLLWSEKLATAMIRELLQQS